MTGVSKKVLIVEDETMYSSLIATIFEERGYSVFTAGDGDAGLQVLDKEKNIDVVITDIFMPNREGIGFIRAVRRRYSGVKIAAMTGAVNYESILSIAQDFGADLTIQKPSNIDAFADQIDELITG